MYREYRLSNFNSIDPTQEIELGLLAQIRGDTIASTEDLVVYTGADDQEMRRVKSMLAFAGVPAIDAKNIEGQLVSPREAYFAKNDLSETNHFARKAVAECRVEGLSPDIIWDHHNVGDPGDLPPERYWEAATVGQVATFLQKEGFPVEVTHEDEVLAAVDHCYVAANEDRCPGIAPEEADDMKIRGIADKFGMCIEAVGQMVDDFRPLVREAKKILLGNEEVLDLTPVPLGEFFGLHYLVAQVAVVKAGESAILRSYDGLPERTLTGHATPSQVQTFLEEYVPRLNLIKPYGMPMRRYAGAYEQP